MAIDALSEIDITDADIDEIELLLGNLKFDSQRRDILKCMDSIDIQAFPGSGKTTVLIAKLAILAKKWPYSDRGICILSHTNVARNEIETRLGDTAMGKSLLSFPHFVGTFHSFFDTFAGLPWLRSNGYPITMIDTEVALTRRYQHLSYGTKSYLARIGLNEYAYESSSFPIAINLKCSKTAPSYREIYSNVDRSFKEGYFTFDEILQFSKCALEQCKYLPAAIQERFPLLFIDEAQDTSQMQWELINSSFPDVNASVRQAFGDANQAIFQSYGSEETVSTFPSDNRLTISNSHRFGSGIAQLADPLGVAVRGLNGSLSTFERLSKKNAVFLFEQATDVLPAYAQYLLSCFSDNEINGGLDCYAVGMVHNKDAVPLEDKKYPVGIKDYYFAYDSEAGKLAYSPQYFVEFYVLGQYLFAQTGDYHPFIENIAAGLRKYVRQNTPINIPGTGKAFNMLIKAISEEKHNAFRTDLATLIKFSKVTNETWAVIVTSARAILKNYFDIESFNANFFRWIDVVELPQDNNSKQSHEKNVFFYQESERTIQVRLSSIHGVKGRTHLATLVLDTFWYDRNIKSILSWLCNASTKKPGKRDLMRLKCHYVALTRAKGFVCIAVPKNSVSDSEKNLLAKSGWNIVEL